MVILTVCAVIKKLCYIHVLAFFDGILKIFSPAGKHNRRQIVSRISHCVSGGMDYGTCLTYGMYCGGIRTCFGFSGK